MEEFPTREGLPVDDGKDIFGFVPPTSYTSGYVSYTGPRVSAPTFPPPPPLGYRPKRRRTLVASIVFAILVVGGTAGVVGFAGPFTQNGSPGSVGSGNSGSGSANGSSTSLNKADVAAISSEVDPAVVDITSILAYQSGEAAGTGMVITPDGEVLTNNHVIDEAESITAQIDGRGPKYTATVVGTDPTSDIAVIQLHGVTGLKTVSFGDSSDTAVGEAVVAIGNALDLPGPPKVTEGSVTALDKPIIAQDSGTALCESLNGMIQTNARLEPGNSGGPLIDSHRQVIGMNTAAASDSSSGGFQASGSKIGFAIPIDKALLIVNQMRRGDGSATVHIGPSPLLGVQVTGINGSGVGTACSSSGATHNPGGTGLGLTAPVDSGALVVYVATGTPAEIAGIQAGDAITSFDNQSVKTADDLTRLVQAERPGDHVEVGWVDIYGTSHRVTVTLQAGPAD